VWRRDGVVGLNDFIIMIFLNERSKFRNNLTPLDNYFFSNLFCYLLPALENETHLLSDI